MNVYDLLREDHETVADMLAELYATTEDEITSREVLFYSLKQELEAHSSVEEQLFYPALALAGVTGTLEAVEDHRLVRELLQELDSAAKGTAEWTSGLIFLKENVEHHVEEEESKLFRKAQEVLTEQQAGNLGARIVAAKRNLTASARG